jgi:hypothetical protein
MRVLSPNERKKLRPLETLPITKHEDFLSTEFYIPANTRSVAQDTSKLSEVQIGQIFKNIWDGLSLLPLMYEGQTVVDWARHHRLIELSHYSFPETITPLRIYPNYGLLPLNQLLSRKELATIGVTPHPGFLYLAARVPFVELGSHILAENRLAPEDRSNLEHWHDELDHRWRGSIADIEICLNAKIVHAFPPREREERSRAFLNCPAVERDYILATPLELPPGFVVETAYNLKQRESKLPLVSQRFFECTMKDHHPPKGYKCPYNLPNGEPVLGEARNWIFSPHPWFVQHILFARAIGGSYWRNTLQRAELVPDRYNG